MAPEYKIKSIEDWKKSRLDVYVYKNPFDSIEQKKPEYLGLMEKINKEMDLLRRKYEERDRRFVDILNLEISQYIQLIHRLNQKYEAMEKKIVHIEKLIRHLHFRSRGFLVPIMLTLIGLIAFLLGIFKNSSHFSQLGLVAMLIPALDVVAKQILNKIDKL